MAKLFLITGQIRPVDQLETRSIGKYQYVHHAKHILEKTQTEALLESQQLYPNVKVKQRKFESLKPFFC